MRKPKFTHKGWLGICPVYLADVHTDGPTVDARRWYFEPLLKISLFVCDVFNFVAETFSDTYEAGYPILITGELPKKLKR